MTVEYIKEFYIVVFFIFMLFAFSPGMGFVIVIALLTILALGILAVMFYPFIRVMFPTLKQIK
jgi:hypothetical protein